MTKYQTRIFRFILLHYSYIIEKVSKLTCIFSFQILIVKLPIRFMGSLKSRLHEEFKSHVLLVN